MRTQEEILNICGLEPLPFKLRQRQLEGINSFIDGNNVALFLPTGYGKTYVAIMAAKYIWKTQGKKTILVGLLKALTEEQYNTFNKVIPTLIDDGDHHQSLDVYLDEEWVVACMTPEKFDVIMNSAKKREIIMDAVGLIITDEAHTIGDESRGHRMENYLITTKLAYPELQYIYLSATVGNPEEFSEWLDSDLIMAEASERPVPLELAIKPYHEVYYPWSMDRDEPIPDHKANFKKRILILQQLIAQNPNKNWLIFATSRKRTSDIANELVGNRKFNTLEYMIEEHGIAYHNAGLDKEQRNYVEEAFRNGTVKICCATPTLAVGVNLPADCCVIFDTEQYSAVHGSEALDANRIQQTIGRAGRPNLSERGYAYIVVPERLEDVITDRAINPLVVKSTLKPRLHEKILQWVGSGLAVDVVDIAELTALSYSNISQEETMNAIDWLTTFGFLKKTEDEDLAITWIGSMTVAMYVLPETVVFWQSQVCNIVDVNDISELYVRFGHVPEYYGVVTVRSEDGDKINYAQYDLGTMFPPMKKHCDNRMCLTCGSSNVCFDKEYKVDNCKQYICNSPLTINDELLKCYFLTFADDMEKKHEMKKPPIISAGDRMLLKDAGERMFNAASVIFGKHKTLSENLKVISLMTSAGTLQKELIELCKLKKIGLKRAELLFNKGFKTVDSVLNGDVKKVAWALKLSERVVKQIIDLNKSELL